MIGLSNDHTIAASVRQRFKAAADWTFLCLRSECNIGLGDVVKQLAVVGDKKIDGFKAVVWPCIVRDLRTGHDEPDEMLVLFVPKSEAPLAHVRNVLKQRSADADAINEATDLIPVSYMHQNLLLGAIDTIVNRMLPADRN